MYKKKLAILLSLVCMINLVNVFTTCPVMAENDINLDNFDYKIDANGASIDFNGTAVPNDATVLVATYGNGDVFTGAIKAEIDEATGKIKTQNLDSVTVARINNSTSLHIVALGLNSEDNKLSLKPIAPVAVRKLVDEGDQKVDESKKDIELVKFIKKFTNTNFLYRIGNMNEVKIGSLFASAYLADIDSSKVNITIETIDNTGAIGTYTANESNWAEGILKFEGTGVVKLTISENNKYAKTQYLEVVEAKNITAAEDATTNNVVLLNDIGFGYGLKVSNGCAIYGNGFGLISSSDYYAKNMSYSFIEMSDGILDNIIVKCPVFPLSVLYVDNMKSSDNCKVSERNEKGEVIDRYYNVRNAINLGGNSVISNSFVSGGRVAIYAVGDNCRVTNSTISGGAAANIQLSSGSLTLTDVTTVQKPLTPTSNKANTIPEKIMGLGIISICDGVAPKLILKGHLIQDNWVSDVEKNYIPQKYSSIATAALSKKDYVHNINGKDCVNLGIVHWPQDTSVTPNIEDNRLDTNTVPYKETSISDAKIYSYENSNGTDPKYYNTPEYVSNRYNDVNPVPIFENDVFSLSKSYDKISDSFVYTYTSTPMVGTLTINPNLLKLEKYGISVEAKPYTYNINTGVYSEYTGEFTLSEKQPVLELYYRGINDLHSVSNGIINGENYEFSIIVKYVATVLNIEKPTYTATYQTGLCVANSKGGSFSGAAPALEGINVRYYSVKQQDYVDLDLAKLTPNTTGKQNGTSNTWEYKDPNNDFTLKLTGGQVHQKNQINAMPVVCDNKLYFVASSENGLVKAGNSARSVPVSYEFTDGYNNTLSWQHTWSVAEDKDNEYNYYDFCDGKLTKFTSCIATGTLITLADGSQKAIEEISKDDKILVWDFFKGDYSSQDVAILVNHGKTCYDIANLDFSDGSSLRVIADHGLFDYDLNKFVYITVDNCKEYIGHRFVAHNSSGGYDIITLTKAFVTNEITNAYSITSSNTSNAFASGILTVAPPDDFYNWIEMGGILKYDIDKFNSDVEKYGTYDYGIFKDYVTYEQFVAWNGKYLKIPVEKGQFTFDDIIDLINTYKKWMP